MIYLLVNVHTHCTCCQPQVADIFLKRKREHVDLNEKEQTEPNLTANP